MIFLKRFLGTSQQHSVRAMPTFLALLNGMEIGRLQGADPNGLERMIVDGLARIPKVPAGEHVANPSERKWLQQFVHSVEKVTCLILVN